MESVPKDGDVTAQVSGSEPLEKQSNDDSKNRTDRQDKFALRVKSEFVLSERSPLMAPFAERPDADPRDGQKDNKKRNRGMNKKRSRDAKVSDEDRVCLSVVRGEECSYGEKCRYNHDLKEILANRLPDIKELEGGCPNFNLKG
jgi:tRNA-dihydrouridine synthase 3